MLNIQHPLFTTSAFVAQLPGAVPARDMASAISTMNQACFTPGAFDASRCAVASADVGRLRMQTACSGGTDVPRASPSASALFTSTTDSATARASANVTMLQALAAIGSTPSLAAAQLPCGRAPVLASTAPAYLAAAYPGNGLLATVPTSPFAPPMQVAAQLFSVSQ